MSSNDISVFGKQRDVEVAEMLQIAIMFSRELSPELADKMALQFEPSPPPEESPS